MNSLSRAASSLLLPILNAASARLFPGPLRIATLLITGIWLADAFTWHPAACLAAAIIGLASCILVYRSPALGLLILHLVLVSIGGALWAVRASVQDGRDLALLLRDSPAWAQSPVRLQGTIASIPALDTVRDSLAAQNNNSNQQPRTTFLFNASQLRSGDQSVPVRGVCRISVDGDATPTVCWGDHVQLIGRVDTPPGPSNPGEFDFARYLQRTGISAQVFLRHPAAVQTLQPAPPWSLRRLLNAFRQQTVKQLQQCLSTNNRATAEALLLGNRGRLPTELEQDFVVSGTMHLLAISGLHVGILYVFILRLLHLLLIPRGRALIIAAAVCLLYAFLTDLRPSVLRAALFIIFSAAGQFCCRELRMGPLIGLTAIVLAVCDPSVAFDVGAWLSFLAVGALGWVSERTPPPHERTTPADSPALRDRITDIATAFGRWLLHSYRQMFAVTLLSAPLIAQQFHLISLTGLLVNLVLIPFTTLTLAAGYIFVAAALLLPISAPAASLPFDKCLSLMNWAVSLSAEFRSGFIMIPDLPAWFLPAWYTTLAASALAPNPSVRHALRLLLMVLTSQQLSAAGKIPDYPGLTCTVLNVGHGNAVVVETEQKVLVFDAGAMNRGGRTAAVISSFLWHRGYSMIDAIIISHPDADHYNATVGLAERMPVGQIITTKQFIHSPALEARSLINRLQQLNVPVTIAGHDDALHLQNLEIHFLQGTQPPAHNPNIIAADNESSLTAILRFAGHAICLPGDLEGHGQQQLLPLLPHCSLLVSPHHGSPAANPPQLGHTTQPRFVVVSARDDRHINTLQQSFPNSQLFHTSTSGAVTIHVDKLGNIHHSQFRKDPNNSHFVPQSN